MVRTIFKKCWERSCISEEPELYQLSKDSQDSHTKNFIKRLLYLGATSSYITIFRKKSGLIWPKNE